MATKFQLKHADGTKVAAQEAYDAFMNTRVLINATGTGVCEAVSMVWYDNNSEQNNPTNVGYVILSIVYDNNGGVGISTYEAGNPSLAPA